MTVDKNDQKDQAIKVLTDLIEDLASGENVELAYNCHYGMTFPIGQRGPVHNGMRYIEMTLCYYVPPEQKA